MLKKQGEIVTGIRGAYNGTNQNSRSARERFTVLSRLKRLKPASGDIHAADFSTDRVKRYQAKRRTGFLEDER